MKADTPRADSCAMCIHWKPRENKEMARSHFARCALGPAWSFLPPQQTCGRHKPLAADAAAVRLAWLAKG